MFGFTWKGIIGTAVICVAVIALTWRVAPLYKIATGWDLPQ